MSIKDLAEKIELINSKKDLRKVLDKLCHLSSNERSNKEIILLLDKAIEKSEFLNDELSLAYLTGYKIPMLYNDRENIPEVRKLISRMKLISEKNCYKGILAWVYSYMWYIEKFEGNKEESKNYINQSVALLEETIETDEYIGYFIKYSYAFEQWLEENNPQSAFIFEECVEFFHRNGFYRSLVQTLAVLFVIYQETQNGKKAIKITQKLLSRNIPFNKLPLDIQAYSYYFVGLSHKLQLNLSLAERYLTESRNILEKTLERSIYSVYYLPVLSHLSTILALQGKMEQALELIKIVEKLLRKDLYSNYLDSTSKSQIIHSFNLVKFYVKSRIFDTYNEITELIDDVYREIKVNYSNAIMITEFLLNANLNVEQLKELRNSENVSLKRVGHIINFLIENAIFKVDRDEKQQNQHLIEALQKRFKEDEMTYIEKAYADLLIAQQLFSSNRYVEIYPLLKKYEKQLHRIEVLELRIFVEAFIQIGAYKNGDPLGPALHFIAMKKCKMYGFSCLERTLDNYLQMLKQDILNTRLQSRIQQ